LELRGPFEEDIERLPFLSKYQFFLGRIKPDATFDRECKEVRAVRELKPLRDNYVHEMARGLQHAASVLGAGLQAAGAGGL
jgi:hypothetical protein